PPPARSRWDTARQCDAERVAEAWSRGGAAVRRQHGSIRFEQRNHGAAGDRRRLIGGSRFQGSQVLERHMVRTSWIRAFSTTAAVGVSVLIAAASGPAVVADAAQAGDREAVKTLLKQAADVN